MLIEFACICSRYGSPVHGDTLHRAFPTAKERTGPTQAKRHRKEANYSSFPKLHDRIGLCCTPPPPYITRLIPGNDWNALLLPSSRVWISYATSMTSPWLLIGDFVGSNIVGRGNCDSSQLTADQVLLHATTTPFSFPPFQKIYAR